MDILPEGTFFAAGCTPDGACWPDFRTERPAYVRYMDEPIPLNGRLISGLCLCGQVAVFQVQSENLPPGWTPEMILAHEAGHDTGVTMHEDGEVWSPDKGSSNHE